MAAALIAVGGFVEIALALGRAGAVAQGPGSEIAIVTAGVLFGVGWLWLGRNAMQAAPPRPV